MVPNAGAGVALADGAAPEPNEPAGAAPDPNEGFELFPNDGAAGGCGALAPKLVGCAAGCPPNENPGVGVGVAVGALAPNGFADPFDDCKFPKDGVALAGVLLPNGFDGADEKWLAAGVSGPDLSFANFVFFALLESSALGAGV